MPPHVLSDFVVSFNFSGLTPLSFLLRAQQRQNGRSLKLLIHVHIRLKLIRGCLTTAFLWLEFSVLKHYDNDLRSLFNCIRSYQ